jgi:hypothetical protein
MNHSFNTENAKKYGIIEAILLENITYWIAKNKASGRHYYNGKWWTYNSAKAFNEIFNYISKASIKRALNHLIDLKVIKRGNFNKISYDRTSWYSIENECQYLKNININNEISIHWESEFKNEPSKVEFEPSKVEFEPSKVEFEPTIPDINTDINTDIKHNIYIGDFSEKIISALNEFKLMRKNIKKPLTAGAEKRIIERLKKISDNEEEQIKIINQSIDHCWQDFYQLKGEENGRNRKIKCDYPTDSNKYDGI